jgi:hypothetical protein
VFVFACLAAACGKDSPPTAPTPATTVVRMDIEGPTVRGIDQPGGSVQLRATAQLSDGTRPDVTNEAAWTVVDPRVLTVSRGMVTGVAIGGTIVTASYRGWSSVTNVTVGPNGGRPVFSLTGVVRDAESGDPIAGAQFRREHSHGTQVLAVSDDNGVVNLGEMSGEFIAVVTRFGYENSGVRVASVREPTVLDVRLRSNGPFVERTVAGTFEPPPPSYEESWTTLRINTRAGGVFDAVLRPSTCAPETSVRVRAESAGASFGSGWEPCGARIRFVVPASEVVLTLSGIGARDWQLTYREPR